MSGQNRTFVLQVVGVTMLVAVTFFVFLRPSDPGELSGIDAPGRDAPPFALPGSGGDERDGRKASRRVLRGAPPVSADEGSTLVAGAGSSRGPGAPPTGDGPPGDQYTSTAVALMERVRAELSGGDR